MYSIMSKREVREANGWTKPMCCALRYLIDEFPYIIGWTYKASVYSHIASFTFTPRSTLVRQIPTGFMLNASQRTVYAYDKQMLDELKALGIPYAKIELSKNIKFNIKN